MKKPSIKSFKHIAVIQTAFLGDVVLALPLAQRIRETCPNARLSFVSTPLAAGITASAKAIDHVITYDKRGIRRGLDGIKYLAAYLNEQNVDCIISCHRSLRTSMVTFLAKADYSVGFNLAAFSFAYKKRIKYKKNSHEIERNLSLLNAFQEFDGNDIAVYEPGGVVLDISDNDANFVESVIHSKGISTNKLIAVAPGTVWETKGWKVYHFKALVAELEKKGYSCVLIGSEGDAELCGLIANSTNAVNLGGMFTLPQTLSFLKRVELLITNDSAPTHFAAIVNCPTLTIYGPTTPIFGFSPRSTKNKSIGLDNLQCRPCAIHGGKSCPLDTHECMKALKPEIVLDEALKLFD